MKIKKKTGIMMIAASTAAVVGVAAVSFAAWTGASDFTAMASTGNVTFRGLEANLTENSGFEKVGDNIQFVDSLVPYNQDGTLKDGMTTVLSGKVDYEITETSVFTVSFENNVAPDWITGNTKIYVKVASTALSAPTTIDNTWKEVTADVVNLPTEVSPTEDGTPTTGSMFVNVILDSNNTADMNKNFSLTFGLVAKPVQS